MMNKLYVLICENWTGTSYDKEVIEIYKDEELAQRTALVSQGNTPRCDTSYYVEAVDYNGIDLESTQFKIPEWDASLTYQAGDKVMYNGVEVIMGNTTGVISDERENK